MSTGGIKVLVVDDSAVVRQALRNIFEAVFYGFAPQEITLFKEGLPFIFS